MRKRFEVRRLAGVPMEVISSKSDLPLEFVSYDLSPEGAFLMTDAEPRIGESLVCCFSLGGRPKPFCFFAEVARVARGRRLSDGGPRGFGVRFLDPTALERLTIRASLKSQPRSFSPFSGAARASR